MQAVDVIKHDPGLKAVGLAAGRNWRKALEQARSLGATKVALWDVQAAAEAERSKGYLGLENLEVLSGQEGVERLAALSSAHTVLHAVPGFLGVKLLLRSLEGGKRVRQKRSAGMCRELVRDYVQGNLILPVDSEHSAIFSVSRESLNEVDYIT